MIFSILATATEQKMQIPTTPFINLKALNYIAPEEKPVAFIVKIRMNLTQLIERLNHITSSQSHLLHCSLISKSKYRNGFLWLFCNLINKCNNWSIRGLLWNKLIHLFVKFSFISDFNYRKLFDLRFHFNELVFMIGANI